MKIKRSKKIYHTNTNEKRATVAILMSDKADFKTKILLEIKKVILSR